MTTNLTFDDWYAEISQAWQRKAEALQARRWQALERKIADVKIA